MPLRRTRAVVPVHCAGVACELDAIPSIAQKHGLCVIEGCRAGLCAPGIADKRWAPLASWPCSAFIRRKNYTAAGEGGAF